MIDVDGIGLDDGDEAEGLMRRLYPLVFEAAYADASTDLGIELAFDLDSPAVQNVLGDLARKVRSVADTTREEIRAAVGRAAESGASPAELAEELADLAEIRSKSRALMIARTETAAGYNLGAVLAFTDAGVTHVTVLDGDEDEPCKSANGSTWTLAQAQANPIGHPNCTRAFAAVIE